MIIRTVDFSNRLTTINCLVSNLPRESNPSRKILQIMSLFNSSYMQFLKSI